MSENQKDLLQLIHILSSVIEANKGVPTGDDNRIIDAEGLAYKFYFHVLSTLYLYRGVNLPDLSIPIINFPDPSSIDVLVRASFETSLVFYYIFINPHNEDERDLRYLCWVISGLYQRQGFPAKLKENIEKLKQDRKLIAILEDKIIKNHIYTFYPEKTKTNLFDRFKKGNWRDKGWAEIAKLAGYSDLNSIIIYNLLCDRAHSGNLSVMQVWQARDNKERKQLMEASMGHLLICTAFMIQHYCKYFPKSKHYYIENYKEPNIVNLWADVGAGRIEE